ncbi:MAG: ribose-phosphate diphosphokinase, partial [Clostridiales bacterium]|nr:ribose-phosphate diphosphokinase [Clostridiales bacterium]
MTSASDEKAYSRYDQYGDNPMAPVGPIGLIALRGSEDFTEKVNFYLNKRRSEYQKEQIVNTYPGFFREDYTIPVENARFSSGEGKAVVKNTVRGHDLYLISDIMNCSCTYKMFGTDNRMSPDDHYQDLKRVILACSGKSRRINVIMPFLYESRQHKRNARESLDCAFALEELYDLGVANIITFDAHDERVANAIPLAGFESLPTTYQIIKEMYRQVPDLSFSSGKFMIISPDEGGIGRAMYYASILGVPLGTFYKRRDYTRVVNGRNPIVAHEFLGDSVEGMDILIVDDMISSGDSMIDIAREMKDRGACKVFCAVT